MATTATANLRTAALDACSDNANTSYAATFVKKGRFTMILSLENDNLPTNKNNSHRMLNSSRKRKVMDQSLHFRDSEINSVQKN